VVRLSRQPFAMSRKLQNYLRSYRKRFGLSQKEVAFLLGIQSSENISHHENFQQVPNLHTALAFQAVFGVPVAELFAGIYEQVEKETANRARMLMEKMKDDPLGQAARRKAELLRA